MTDGICWCVHCMSFCKHAGADGYVKSVRACVGGGGG